jgi:hypothetical protein
MSLTYRKQIERVKRAESIVMIREEKDLASAHSDCADEHEKACSLCTGRLFRYHYARKMFHESQLEKHWQASALSSDLRKVKHETC